MRASVRCTSRKRPAHVSPMNDLAATAPPMPAHLPPIAAAPRPPAPGRRLWQSMLEASPALSAADAQALDALAAQRLLVAGDWVFTHFDEDVFNVSTKSAMVMVRERRMAR